MTERHTDELTPIRSETSRLDDQEVGHYDDPSFESLVPWAVEPGSGGRGG